MPKQRLFLSPPHMSGGEFEYVKEAFSSNYIAPLGPMVDVFEQAFAEYTGITHCVALSSGTAAMHIALRLICDALRVKSDEKKKQKQKQKLLIFASTLTFIGSVSPATFEGCDITFIDSDRESWNMDPQLLAEEMDRCDNEGRLPLAVVPTDLYGQCADYDRIYDICKKYGVPVVVDAAEAMGAKYRVSAECSVLSTENTTDENRITSTEQWIHAGKGATAAVFSFNGNKIITTSGGGMLASDDKELIERARFLSQQARERFAHYEHEEVGYNYRMSNILAAIGRGQLQVLDDRVKRKREIFDYYRAALKDVIGIEFMPEADYGRCNRWLTVILITPEQFGTDRETVRLTLEKENIESRPVWKPMHMQPVFQSAEFQKTEKIKNKNRPNKKRYPCRVVGGEVAEGMFAQGLCLPSGTAMTNSDMDRVIETIIKTGRF
jgi:dTDP-4-amino-4,6-dideoxygalactose transaminase